jgi:hypothetical protein
MRMAPLPVVLVLLAAASMSCGVEGPATDAE